MRWLYNIGMSFWRGKLMTSFREQVESYIIANPQKEYENIKEKFLSYWEAEYKGEIRWMREKTFKIGGRLAQWKRNETLYSNRKKVQKFRELASRINPLK